MSPTEGSQYRNWLYRQRKNRKGNEGGGRQKSRTLVPMQKETIVCLGSWNHSKLQERRWKGEGPSCKTRATERRTQGRKASQKGMERHPLTSSLFLAFVVAPVHPLAKLPSSQRATEPGKWSCLQDGAESMRTQSSQPNQKRSNCMLVSGDGQGMHDSCDRHGGRQWVSF